MNNNVTDFRQKDADELHAVTGAIFGSWERDPADGDNIRVPGILERLDRIERVMKYGVILASAAGAAAGSMMTHLIEAAMRFH